MSSVGHDQKYVAVIYEQEESKYVLGNEISETSKKNFQ